MLNCNEATFLLAKKEEGKLSIKNRLHLVMHIAMCKFCRRFEKQMKLLKKESSNISDTAPIDKGILNRLDRTINDAINNSHM